MIISVVDPSIPISNQTLGLPPTIDIDTMLRCLFRRPIRRLLNHNSRLCSSTSPGHALKPLPPFVSPPPKSKSAAKRAFDGVVKFGSYSVVAIFAATAGVTYVYTLKEACEKTQRITDFTASRVPGYKFEDPEEETTNSLTKSAVPPDHQDPPPLEFKSPFVASVVTYLGEVIYLYLNVRCVIEELYKEYVAPRPDKLLPDPLRPGLFTLVLDLNDTLIHSDWLDELKRGEQAFKRPGFHAFLDSINACGYEVVLYTDVHNLDVMRLFQALRLRKSFWHILTAGSITFEGDKCYRDLSKLNRDPARILYVSAHARENCLQPENCIEIKPWKKEEMDDTTLTDLIPFLKAVAYKQPSDVRRAISGFKKHFGRKANEVQPREEGAIGA